MAVKDYNVDPDLNTTIEGINIAEGCPPSGINNAIRQLMADVKEESTAQTQAVAGAKTDAASQVSVLETTLRTLIAQELAKKLSTTGGTMTGAITLDAGPMSLVGAGTSGVGLFSKDSWDSPFVLLLPDGIDDTNFGKVWLRGYKSGGVYTDVLVNSDGTVTINNDRVLTSAGGHINGDFIFSSGRIGTLGANNEFLIFANETGIANGSVIAMRTENASVPYSILMRAGRYDQNSQSVIELRPDGTFTHNGSSILTAARGVLLHNDSVQVFSCPTGGGWTAPAGGTWAYLICGEFNAQNIYGTVAGGTYVAWPNGGHPAQGIAFRIAN